MLKILFFCSFLCLFACKSIILKTEIVKLPSEDPGKGYFSVNFEKKNNFKKGYILRVIPTKFENYSDTVSITNLIKGDELMRLEVKPLSADFTCKLTHEKNNNIPSNAKQKVIIFIIESPALFLTYQKNSLPYLMIKNDTFIVLKKQKIISNPYVEQEYRNHKPLFLSKNELWYSGQNWTNFEEMYAYCILKLK